MLDTQLLVVLRVIFRSHIKVRLFDWYEQIGIVPCLRFVKGAIDTNHALLTVSDICQIATVS